MSGLVEAVGRAGARIERMEALVRAALGGCVRACRLCSCLLAAPRGCATWAAAAACRLFAHAPLPAPAVAAPFEFEFEDSQLNEANIRQLVWQVRERRGNIILLDSCIDMDHLILFETIVGMPHNCVVRCGLRSALFPLCLLRAHPGLAVRWGSLS